MIAYFFACLALASAAPYTPQFNLVQKPFMPLPPRPPQVHDANWGVMHPPPPPPPPVHDTNWGYMRPPPPPPPPVHNSNWIEFYNAQRFPGSDTFSPDNQLKEYVVIVYLIGFDEKDIKVKAKEGHVIVEAVYNSDDSNKRSFFYHKTLPAYVNVNGTWTFEMGVLKITFPVNSNPEVSTETAVEQTQSPNNENHDREEMKSTQNENENQDAEVGVERGDKDTEILTNVIHSGHPVEGFV